MTPERFWIRSVSIDAAMTNHSLYKVYIIRTNIPDAWSGEGAVLDNKTLVCYNKSNKVYIRLTLSELIPQDNNTTTPVYITTTSVLSTIMFHDVNRL